MKMSAKKRDFARLLREGQTPYEKLVWELLRDRRCFGLKFRRQHVIEGFVVDFYCHELRLAIELDGSVHLSQQDYDRLRDEIIEAENIQILRITNRAVFNDSAIIYKKIKRILDDQK